MNKAQGGQYGQRSANTTLQFCQKLKETQDVPGLIQEFSKRIPVKGDRAWNVDLSRKATPFKDTYTRDNLMTQFQQGLGYNPNSKKEIAANKKLYKWSIEVVQKYYTEHSNTMTNHDKFCLEFFEAGLSSQLGRNKDSIQHYRFALTILEEAVNNKETWAQEVDVPAMKRKLQKHETLSKGPISSIQKGQTVTSEEALYSKTFLNAVGYTIDQIKKIINKLRSYPFSKLVLKVNALNALYNERFSILFTLSDEDSRGVSGYVNWRNTVRIFSDSLWQSSREITRILFHETTHQAMFDVFNNTGAPYAANDQQAQKEYHECMRQVLLNLIDAIFPIDQLAKLECNTLYKIKKSTFESWETGLEFLEFQFPYPWNRNTPLNELLGNFFSGIYAGDGDRVKKIMKSDLVQLPNGQIMKKFHRSTILNDEFYAYSDYVGNLAYKFESVFIHYDFSSIDTEFIANILDPIFVYKPKNLTIIQPLLKYIQKHVEPAMNAYIANHPAKDRIDDRAIENEARYSSALRNARRVLGAGKSPWNAVLGMLMMVIAYISWSIFSELYR